MFATPNSSQGVEHPTRVSCPRQGAGRRLRCGLMLWLLFGTAPPVFAGYTNRVAEAAGTLLGSELHRLAQLFSEAKANFAAAPTNAETAWRFGRACFEWADAATNETQRAQVARQGIEACGQAIQRQSRLAAAHYYLALNLGELARGETFRALKLVRQMETELKVAIELDPKFDYAGPHRALGLLYQDAPGWPVSLGSRKRAREHLLKAVELAPDFPENRLCWLEACLEWGDKQAAESAARVAAEILQEASSRFTGSEWSAAWRDWDSRFARAQARVNGPDSKLRSPRDL